MSKFLVLLMWGIADRIPDQIGWSIVVPQEIVPFGVSVASLLWLSYGVVVFINTSACPYSPGFAPAETT